MFDAIIVGGGFAGLSAALQLARARRSVLLVDAGAPRNRFAASAHGFLGHDGKPPQQIRDEARQQLARYPTVTFADGAATAAIQSEGGFLVAIDSAAGERQESQKRGKRLVLATGVRDELPPLPGLAERWGHTVIHCPYCHGYEVAGQPLGILGGDAMAAHKAAMIPDWGPATLFTQGGEEPAGEQAALLAARAAGRVEGGERIQRGLQPPAQAGERGRLLLQDLVLQHVQVSALRPGGKPARLPETHPATLIDRRPSRRNG